jgi:hypothetical protein
LCETGVKIISGIARSGNAKRSTRRSSRGGRVWMSYSNWFMRTLQLGSERGKRGIRSRVIAAFGNAARLWMWDYCTLATELEHAGFVKIRRCAFGDCVDERFRLVEEEDRFHGSCAIEAQSQ